MAGRHERHFDSSPDTFTASIPLQERHDALNIHDEPDSDVDATRSTSYPESPHHDIDINDISVPLSSSRGFFDKLKTFIMSRNPLLIRSSPALGTGSYGALPITQTSEESESDQDDRRRERRANERASSAHAIRLTNKPSHATLRKAATLPRHSQSHASTSASDLGLGLEGKSSFAGGGPVPSRAVFDSGPESSNVSDDDFEGEDGFKSDDPDPVDNSPYAQVRASVPATDNTTLSIGTPRMWVLSLLFALVGSATNLFFSLRYPSITITPVIALVLVHPLGRLWDLLLKRQDDPVEVFVDGVKQTSPGMDNPPRSATDRFRLWLAQGHWNEKEHACVYISSNVSFGFAFATDIIVEQHKFYKQEVPLTYQILLTLSTQILGYAFAGLTRQYLVRPAAMIWPGTLMSTAMFTAMHKQENKPADGWTISRYRFFVIAWACAFAWYFLPGLIMPALSYFSVITWFAPKNVVVANLFGVSSGLGLFPMTFDWAQIAYIGSPLLTPWWAAANVVGGLILVMWFIAPVLYYKNVLFASYMPILSSMVFDNQGKQYDVSRILTKDFVFDKVAYEAYSRVYLPITYVLSYAVQFASLSALVTHTACWHGRDIWKQSQKAIDERKDKTESAEYQAVPNGQNSRGARHASLQESESGMENLMSGREDVHSRLMRRYKDAPMLWYFITFVAMFTIGIFVVEYYPTHLPWYGLVLALGITTVLFIPVGIVMAITNQHSSLYLICQLICGVVFPGRPVANMVFTTYCYISSAQGIKFSSDLKLGHYMKVPPRLLFQVQMVATLVSSFTQIGVLNWMFANISGICTPQAINGFTCPIARVHFNGSILWGVVGPQRFFGPGALYRPLVWAFLVGAIAPIGVYMMGRGKKKSIWQKVNLPVLFGSLSWIPPATGLNFSVWAIVCFSFNSVLRRRAPGWWGKYTMTLSAALDSGIAFALLVVFFGFVYPGFTKDFHWWGTEVYKHTCDWLACPYLPLGPGEKFDR